ncbi:MAG TPA: carbohydrate porin [Stellaceae bacterium]|nr:carbohydrate porin [Stellaceae bacterium]
MRHGRGLARLIGPVALLLGSLPALAQTAPGGEAPPAAPAGLWEREHLLGDLGGLRPWLQRHGVALTLSETSEGLGNLTGGLRRDFAYDGLTNMELSLDAEKAFGWKGATFDVSALQIHGRNLSADVLNVLQTASGIEANRATRLWELWYQQAFLGGKADLKIGQQSTEREFIISDYAGVFINSAMGWPALTALDLYAGGPAYPLSSLGLRLRAKPAERLTVLAGVFDDNPPGGPFLDDLQIRDGEASGTRFNLGTGALFLGEVQYAAPRPPFADRHRDLPGTYKFGVWADTGPFPDRRFDTAGLSLAAPSSTGVPRLHRGNFGLYGVVDQTVWRPNPKAERALGVFVRALGAPGDRNLVDVSLIAGIDWKAPLPGRKDDQFAIGYGLVHLGSRAAALDRDRAFFAGAAPPARSEHFIEITYDWKLAGWWELQPDFQYFINPLESTADVRGPLRRPGDEAVLGLRTRITF